MSGPQLSKARRRQIHIALPLAGVLTPFLLFAAITAATKRPVPNEGWFADAAWRLASTGKLQTTILETSGTWLEGIGRRTYWILPLHLLAEAAVFRIFGVSLWKARSLSLVWGAVGLLAWFQIVRTQGGRGAALLTAVLLAADFHYNVSAAISRMDMMCAALGACGIAAYLWLRDRSMDRAVLAANVFVAAACFTHPCGAIYVVSLVLIAISLDRSRLRWRYAWLAVLPYAAGAAAYGVYIARDAGLFLRQFFGNVSGLAGEASNVTRFSGLRAPLTALWREIYERYAAAFADQQIPVLLLYWGAVLVILTDRRLRREPGARVLLIIAGVGSVMLWLLDGLKPIVYLVHVIPPLAGLGALWIRDWTAGRPRLRTGIVCGMVCIQAAIIIPSAIDNTYRNQYFATVEYLRSHARPDSLIMASGEFGFDFGFDANVIDDVRLGYFTGKSPEFYVKNEWYGDWLHGAETRDPAVYRHVRDTLAADYREVYRNREYTVYRRESR
ncbi:MAG TPA: glycosyltransferase family 39 protein [Bryobacteraceae bacterium]